MKNIPKVITTLMVVYSIFATIAVGAIVLIVSESKLNIGSNIIFVGSIVTLFATIITPFFSLKSLNFNSYAIKLYSLLFGILGGGVVGWLLYLENPFILDVVEYSKSGLIWGINIALLLIGLVILEVENSEEKIKTFSEDIINEKNINSEKNKVIMDKNKEIIKMKKEISKKSKKEEEKGE